MTFEKLNKSMRNCENCGLRRTADKTVPGEGPTDADLMLIGQNPGAKEDETGKPFVGRSGKFLDKMLEKYGIDRDRVFITSVLKHKTPDNRRPKDDEIEACMPYLVEQIDRIKPNIILLMGKVAWQTPRKEGITYIETYHPSAAMRFTKYRERFEGDMKKLVRIIMDQS